MARHHTIVKTSDEILSVNKISGARGCTCITFPLRSVFVNGRSCGIQKVTEWHVAPRSAEGGDSRSGLGMSHPSPGPASARRTVTGPLLRAAATLAAAEAPRNGGRQQRRLRKVHWSYQKIRWFQKRVTTIYGIKTHKISFKP